VIRLLIVDDDGLSVPVVPQPHGWPAVHTREQSSGGKCLVLVQPLLGVHSVILNSRSFMFGTLTRVDLGRVSPIDLSEMGGLSLHTSTSRWELGYCRKGPDVDRGSCDDVQCPTILVLLGGRIGA
jgi:hypothetical protein